MTLTELQEKKHRHYRGSPGGMLKHSTGKLMLE